MSETTAIKTLTPENELLQTLTKMEPQFKMALPPHIPAERFLRITQTAIRNSPALIACERNSLFSAILRCAQDGLLPDGREAAIVPWGKTARFMPMIAGILKKTRNSGELKTINAIIVCENDEYKAWVDEKGEHFMHVKAKGPRGKAIMTYAYAITKDGGFYFEEITEEDMAKIENMSKASDSPWKGPFRDEMKRKSAIRRLAKYRLPSSSDLDELIRTEDDLYEMKEEKPKQESKTTSSRLGKIIGNVEEKQSPVAQDAEISEINDEEIPI